MGIDPVINLCDEHQRQVIQLAFSYGGLTLFNAASTIEQGTSSPVFRAMFKDNSNIPPLRQLFELMSELKAIPGQPKNVPGFSCAENHPMWSVVCNLGKDPKYRQFVILANPAEIFLCPRFFDQALAPAHLICPDVQSNVFALTREGNAVALGQAFDLLSALIAIYTNTPSSNLGPPKQAINVLNVAMACIGQNCVQRWNPIAGYFLCKISLKNGLQC